MRTAMERRPYRDKAAVHAGGAMHGRAAVPSATARRQDGGSSYRGSRAMRSRLSRPCHAGVVALVATILGSRRYVRVCPQWRRWRGLGRLMVYSMWLIIPFHVAIASLHCGS